MNCGKTKASLPPNRRCGQEASGGPSTRATSTQWTGLIHAMSLVRCVSLSRRRKALTGGYSQKAYDLIERDGFSVLDNGRIVGGPTVVLREGALANLTDPGAIREHLSRISRAIESDDPAQAIGSAKELIESTAKVVLREVEATVDDAWDIPKLVHEAQVALLVHPTTAVPGPDGSDAVKRILGGVTTVAESQNCVTVATAQGTAQAAHGWV